jgi:undecaprenyl-diphosphatase
VTLLAAALLGIVQGVTEFLPISSTAHLLLLGKAIGYDDPGGVFTVMIQLGSILAVVWLYRVRLFGIAARLTSSAEARHFAAAVIVATLPVLLAGALFADYIQSVLYKSPRVFAGAFIIGGVVMLLVERLRPAPVVVDVERTPLSRAFGVGVCQVLSLVPGVSRSGATISAARFLGFERNGAARLSFLMALPVTLGAVILKVPKLFAGGLDPVLVVGIVTAGVVGVLSIRVLFAWVKTRSYLPFVIYRFAFSALIVVVWLARS